MNNPRRICVRGLIYRDGKLFGQKLLLTNGNWWCTPGGGVEPLESLHVAMERELIEETGVKPKIGRLILVQQFTNKNPIDHTMDEQVEFFFLIENVDDYESINLENTSHGSIEIAEYGFVDPIEKNMLPAILQTNTIIDAIIDERPVIFYTQLQQ